MGQQQLLLLVLGIVIVGLAVVVGIQAFSENMKKANADALINDGIRIASDAQAWKLKPAAFGGGAAETDFTGLTLAALGYVTDDAENGACADGEYNSTNGCVAGAVDGTTFVITATNTDQDNEVVVTVSGTQPGDIDTAVNEEAPAGG